MKRDGTSASKDPACASVDCSKCKTTEDSTANPAADKDTSSGATKETAKKESTGNSKEKRQMEETSQSKADPLNHMRSDLISRAQGLEHMHRLAQSHGRGSRLREL